MSTDKYPIDVIECRGTKCRLRWDMWYGIHCTSCFPVDDEMYGFIPEESFVDVNNEKITFCCESGCGRSYADGMRAHCLSCNGEPGEDEERE